MISYAFTDTVPFFLSFFPLSPLFPSSSIYLPFSSSFFAILLYKQFRLISFLYLFFFLFTLSSPFISLSFPFSPCFFFFLYSHSSVSFFAGWFLTDMLLWWSIWLDLYICGRTFYFPSKSCITLHWKAIVQEELDKH